MYATRLFWTTSFDLLQTAAGKHRAIETRTLDVPHRSAFSSRCLMSNQHSRTVDRREDLPVRTKANPPRQLCAQQGNIDLAASELLLRRMISFRSSYVPISQTITAPAPYWPAGITPSNSAYSSWMVLPPLRPDACPQGSWKDL